MGQCGVIIWRNRVPDLNGNENGSGRVFLQPRSRTNYHSRCRVQLTSSREGERFEDFWDGVAVTDD